MGCDIHCYVEVYENDKWSKVGAVFPVGDDASWLGEENIDRPIYWAQYGLFAFLAGVRNISGVEPLAYPKGIPADISSAVLDIYNEWGDNAHSMSWLTLKELLGVDYNTAFTDKTEFKEVMPGIWSWGVGIAGDETTLRDFLGIRYFNMLEMLQSLGDQDKVRLVFWFDN